MADNKWKMRIANNCLFIDDVSLGWPILQHTARPGLRPYIHPLRISDGKICLTEDSPWHHPWQHGIATGYHGVNGCDFWFDPGQHPTMTIGSIEPSTPRILSEDPPTWEIESIWRHADGSMLLIETQKWQLSSQDEFTYLDMEWTLLAVPDVTITQDAYGGLFIRMPFRKQWGANVMNSEGQRDNDTEQQAARWVDLHMPIERDNAVAGMTVFDHPSNPRHPSKWRVDNQRGINPAPCIQGEIKLSAGEREQHSYRLVLHEGTLSPERIEALWQAYVA
ncbi:MAG: PmoA family protein [Chloroflexota bacterium]